MKRAVLALMVALSGVSAWAMPTKAELAKAEKIVGELMSPELAAYKAKSKTAADVAAAALGYADEAQGEAAKYLLLKGAFQFQMRASDYDSALASIARLKSEVKGIPDRTLADMISGALRRVPRSKGGLVYDLLQRTQSRVRWADEAHALERQAKAAPADKALRRQLGERYAKLGDWRKAIEAFAAGDGKLAEMAQWEQKYPETGITELTTAKVADVWWDAGGEDDDLTCAYRAHAAYWYRKAIENNAVPGLMKALAEKRIAEAEKDMDVQVAATSASPADKGRILKLAVGKDVDMELMPCPAGTFEMGYQGGTDVFVPHKVRITRPFWTGKFLVTREQWNAIMPARRMTDVEVALGGLKAAVSSVSRPEVDDFCARLTQQNRRLLPAGYVLRLPTEAEWEYACRANAKPDDPYARPKGLMAQELKEIGIGAWTKMDILKKAGVPFDEKRQWLLPGTVCGQKKPNGWGLYDMIGNLSEMTLDLIPNELPNGETQKPGQTPRGVTYSDAADPLAWTEDASPVGINREGAGWGVSKKCLPMGMRVSCVGFRIVAGPDLVKEKGKGRTAAAPATKPTTAPAPKVAASQSSPQPSPKTFRLGRGVDIEFIGCPAGSFMMGSKGDDSPRSAFRYHKVNITRPFWLSKYKVTHGMWNAYQKVALTKEDHAFGGMKRVHCTSPKEMDAFCEWLTKRFRSNLPKGCVVRLPTEAEWEYAYGAGVTDPSDLYVKICSEQGEWYNVPPRFAEIMVWWETDVEPRLKDAGLDAQIPNLQLKLKGAEVGTKRPNAWGLYDMLGNLGECLLDRFDLGKLKRKNGSPVRGGTGPMDWHNQDAFCFKAEETDPLNWPMNGDVVQMVRGGLCWNRWRGHFFYKGTPGIMGNRLPFRLCIGPDLMKEKGLKKYPPRTNGKTSRTNWKRPRTNGKRPRTAAPRRYTPLPRKSGTFFPPSGDFSCSSKDFSRKSGVLGASFPSASESAPT